MYKYVILFIMLFAIGVVLWWATFLSANIVHDLVKVDQHSGPVEVLKKGSTTWVQAEGTPYVFAGDMIQTRPGGTATLKWVCDGTRLVLAENSSIQVEDFTLKRNQTLTSRFVLLNGQAWMHVRNAFLRNPGSVFEVQTAQMSARVRGTIFSVTAGPTDSRVSVRDGLVQVTAGKQEVDVVAGEQAVIAGTGVPIATKLSPEDAADWATRQDVLRPLLTITRPREEGQLILNTSAVVEGGVEPGSSVTLNGQPVITDEKGDFHTQVSLTPGANTITAVARSPQGLEATETRTVRCKPPKNE
jgi:hypothetical protein